MAINDVNDDSCDNDVNDGSCDNVLSAWERCGSDVGLGLGVCCQPGNVLRPYACDDSPCLRFRGCLVCQLALHRTDDSNE